MKKYISILALLVFSGSPLSAMAKQLKCDLKVDRVDLEDVIQGPVKPTVKSVLDGKYKIVVEVIESRSSIHSLFVSNEQTGQNFRAGGNGDELALSYSDADSDLMLACWVE